MARCNKSGEEDCKNELWEALNNNYMQVHVWEQVPGLFVICNLSWWLRVARGLDVIVVARLSKVTVNRDRHNRDVASLPMAGVCLGINFGPWYSI